MGLILSPARLLFALLLLASLTFNAPSRAAEEGAPQTIGALHDALIQVMKQADELGFVGRTKLVNPAVEAAFDLEFMASKTLGRHSKKLEAADLQRWVETFKHFVVSNYARQFDGYSGQYFETVDVEPAPRETLIVRTLLVRKNDDDVKLNYRLREMRRAPSDAGQGDPESETRWRIIDVYSNGTVSELALRRSEFSALLSRHGFEGLIETVESKSAKE
jgi:phospholipid transport system substrate-binding protein